MNRTDRSRRAAAGRTLVGRIVVAMTTLLFLVGGVSAQQMSSHHHGDAGNSTSANPEAVQDWAKQALAKSPRHQEWVKVKNGTREVNSFVVYPQTNKNLGGLRIFLSFNRIIDKIGNCARELRARKRKLSILQTRIVGKIDFDRTI